MVWTLLGFVVPFTPAQPVNVLFCLGLQCPHAGFVKATGRRRRVLGVLALGPLWGIFSGAVPVGRNALRLPLHFCSKDLLGRLRRNLRLLRIKFFITWVK